MGPVGQAEVLPRLPPSKLNPSPFSQAPGEAWVSWGRGANRSGVPFFPAPAGEGSEDGGRGAGSRCVPCCRKERPHQSLSSAPATPHPSRPPSGRDPALGGQGGAVPPQPACPTGSAAPSSALGPRGAAAGQGPQWGASRSLRKALNAACHPQGRAGGAPQARGQCLWA